MPTEETAADLRGPFGGALHTDGKSEITVIAVTGSTQIIDLGDSNHFNGVHHHTRFVRIVADVDIYYYWSSNASALLDETATAGTTREQQCDYLPAKTPREEAPSGKYFVVKGSAGKCRISITNQMTP